MNVLPIISDYQDGTRNAKVYKDPRGRFCVVIYDSVDDYNGFESFDNIDDAEDFAEDWVLRVS
jgi:hypothetical protein